MFRRRPLRRMLRQATPMGEAGRLALRQANQLNDAGNHEQAAEIFERVAQRMENRQRLNRSAFLFLQAGHSRMLAGQIDATMELVKRGLGILAQNQRWRTYAQGANMMVKELTRLGYPGQAAEIQNMLHQTLPARAGQHQDASSEALPSKTSGKLPGKCPFCGASLRSDMIEWIDDASAECPYCGSTVQAE